MMNSAPRRLDEPPPFQRPTALCTALVYSVAAGTSSGAFGFLLSSVSLSLLHATAPTASATTALVRRKWSLCVMSVLLGEGRHGVIRTLKPTDRAFGSAANSANVPAL